MKTKISIPPLSLYVLLLIVSFFSVYYLFKYLDAREFLITTASFFYCFSILLLFIFSIVYPVTALYRVELRNNYLEYSWIIISRRKKVALAEIEGYYSILLPSRNSEYLTFYPVSRGRVLPAISSFAFSNSGEFIIRTGLKHLGMLPFSWKMYFWNILIRKRIS
jgi:hypothetical protein